MKRKYGLKILLILLVVIPFIMLFTSEEWWYKILWGIISAVTLIAGIIGFIVHIRNENEEITDFEYERENQSKREILKRIREKREMQDKGEDYE